MMTKQEVIEEIKKQSVQAYDDFAIMRDTAIYIVNQLNEPEKPPVPQYIADYIASEQYSCSTLSEAIDNMEDEVEVTRWFYANSETFAKAWLFGYTVKKYKVSFKKNGVGVGVQQRDGSVKQQFTKDELKEYGFDNLDVYEIEEVKE
ncbi:MAG: DUF1642 domain-containing protein [Streptococcus lutetiensis]|nr:DUF1642 domain-containing protein [Streptococcus lutetiensis]MDU7908430.1 DUF1642 domain-containing protein [Streptococcus lutetiensis]